MFHRVRSVKALPDMELVVWFQNGAVKRYDVKPLAARWKPFEALLNVEGMFEQVRVDKGGYGVSWNDELDLSCDELWDVSKDLTDEEREIALETLISRAFPWSR
ncbi:MAG: DUF2442 domain-containing protein [Clostridia bacterium]|nr:DUF2442 domain-containing protein [Clostridia bacterium]